MEVVGAFDASVGGPPGVVPVVDLLVPLEERVDDLVELGDVPGGVDVTEPVKRGPGALAVVGHADAVHLAQGVPGCVETGMEPQRCPRGACAERR